MYLIFEGKDGVGKSELSKLVASRIKNSVHVHEPYGSSAEPHETRLLCFDECATLRKLALDDKHDRYVKGMPRELLLQTNRSILWNEITPFLMEDRCVVTDRSIISGGVYGTYEMPETFVSVDEMIGWMMQNVHVDPIGAYMHDILVSDRTALIIVKGNKSNTEVVDGDIYDTNDAVQVHVEKALNNFEKLDHGIKTLVVHNDIHGGKYEKTLEHLADDIICWLKENYDV